MPTTDQETFFDPEYRDLLQDVSMQEKRVYYRYYIDLERKNLSRPHRILEAMLAVVNELEIPSKKWWLAIGQLLFTTSNYDNLIKISKKYPKIRELKPFLARALVYRGELKEATNICKELLRSYKILEEKENTDILTIIETFFSLGLALLYSRQLEDSKAVITEFETLIKSPEFQERISETMKEKVHFQLTSLKALARFFSGQVLEFQDTIMRGLKCLHLINDAWWKAFFLNLAGIARIQDQKIEEGIMFLKESLALFKKIDDHRGVAVTGGNLGTLMLLTGHQDEGRAILEQAATSSEKVGDFHNALGQLLTLAKSYLDEKKAKSAVLYLNRAEKIAKEREQIQHPIINALFCYSYARLGNLEKAAQYLRTLREMASSSKTSQDQKKMDITTLIWHSIAESINYLARGNLEAAQAHIEEGLYLADAHGHHDLSLEFAHFSLEIILKRFLLNPTETLIHDALYLMDELSLLVKHVNIPHYVTIFHVIRGYLILALSLPEEAMMSLEIVEDLVKNESSTAQAREYQLFKRRVNELLEGNTTTDLCLSEENLAFFCVTEALRLLSQLQFQQAVSGTPIKEKEVTPVALMLMRNDGMTLFHHKFKEAALKDLDEQAMSSFLMALNSFASEIFGKGSLRRIDQGNAILLLEPVTTDLTVVLVTEEETYSLRRKVKMFIRNLKRLNLDPLKDSISIFTEDDPIFSELKTITTDIFSSSSSS